MTGGARVTGAITAPFFEFGPKAFLDRAAVLELAAAASSASMLYDVAVIMTPAALDIEAVRHAAPGLWIFAQAMDTARPGPHTGAITAESLVAVGADGVMLNHAERPLDDNELAAAVWRAREAGLLTMLCADDVPAAKRYALWHPTIVLLEPHELIGGGDHRERPSIADANAEIADVDPDVLVMHSGGVGDENDVRTIIGDGAAGTGCTTAIIQARDRSAVVTRMIQTVRQAWDARERRNLAGANEVR
jgi:triosephosphate isomerase